MITRYPTRLIIALAFVMVAIAYLLQIASPLRLINDGVDYPLQASSALDGNGFPVHGVRSMRPSGYWIEAHSFTRHVASIVGRLLLTLLRAGDASLAFYTRLTFAGGRFPDIYGDGNFRDAYRIVLRGEKPNNGDDVNQDALYLLRPYEWRVSSE